MAWALRFAIHLIEQSRRSRNIRGDARSAAANIIGNGRRFALVVIGAAPGKLRELPRVIEESCVVSASPATSNSESPTSHAVTDQAVPGLQLVLPYAGP